MIPQLTAAVTTLVGAPAEPFETNSEAADATEAASDDVAAAVGSVSGGTADDVRGRADELSLAIGTLNVLLNADSPPSPDNIGDGIDVTINELAAIANLFPSPEAYPIPNPSIRGGLATFIDANGTATTNTLQGGRLEPVNLAELAVQISEIDSTITAFRNAVNALTFIPPLSTNPLTGDLDALLDELIVLLP